MKRLGFLAAMAVSAVLALSGCFGTQVVYVQETVTNEAGQITAVETAARPQGQTVPVSYSNGSGSSGGLSGGSSQTGTQTPAQKTSAVFD